MDGQYFRRADLFEAGMTRRMIASAVRRGALIHVRRDRYLAAGADDWIVRAVRVGGRLSCLSLLALEGVYVQEVHHVHVRVKRTDGRLRSPHCESGLRRLEARDVRGVAVHWVSPDGEEAQRTCVPLVDALIDAARCQGARAMVATLDSVLNKGLLTRWEVTDVLGQLPARFMALEPLLDARAQSGGESYARLIARSIGCSVVPQAKIAGVGYVDLLLDGWLVVECDSKQFHASWAAQMEDMRRDLLLASLGYTRIRLVPFDLIHRPDVVRAALVGLLTSTRR